MVSMSGDGPPSVIRINGNYPGNDSINISNGPVLFTVGTQGAGKKLSVVFRLE